MLEGLLQELGKHGIIGIVGLLLGSVTTWLVGLWRRRRQRQRILAGDARDTVVIAHHLIEEIGTASNSAHAKSRKAMRIRSLGQSELDRVVPNGHLAAILLERAFAVFPHHTLISMEDAEGSYLLETLTNFVCDRVANGPFEHDLYIMAPCCEPAGLAQHQPITILLIAMKDLLLFENWPACRDIQVEHGTDGARILTLMDVAKRFRQEQDKLTQMRQAGQRTRYVETMYILDLALDKRTAAIPTKLVPWGRYEKILAEMNLE